VFPFLWMWVSLSTLSVTSGVSGVRANSDVLWHRYVAAISRLHDVECSYEMQDRSYGHGDHLARGEGYFLNGRYRLFRFNLPRYFWYVERSNFEYEFLPPHDWADRVEFYSEQGGGVFLETHCSLHRSKSPIPYMVPHPVGIFTGGMTLSLTELTNPSEWSIAEIDGRLILDSQSTDRRIELELDSKYGWLPRRAEHHHKNGMVAFEVDEFHQVNGLWFPVVMRTMRSDRSDGKLVPVTDAGHRLIVDKASLKLNPRLPLSAYRFQPPAGAIVHDADSGETIHGEVGLAKLAEFRSVAKLRAPPGSTEGGVSIAVWVAIVSLAIFLSCCILWLWQLMNKPRSSIVGVFLVIGLLLGGGTIAYLGWGGSSQSDEYMKPALKIPRSERLGDE